MYKTCTASGRIKLEAAVGVKINVFVDLKSEFLVQIIEENIVRALEEGRHFYSGSQVANNLGSFMVKNKSFVIVLHQMIANAQNRYAR